MNPSVCLCVCVREKLLVPNLLDLSSTRGWAMLILPPLCGPQQEYDHKKDVRYFNSNSFSNCLIFALPRLGASVVLPLTLFWTFLRPVVYFSQLYASLQFFLNCEILMESKWHQQCVAEKWFSPAFQSLLAVFLIIFPPHSRLRNASMLYLWSLVGLFLASHLCISLTVLLFPWIYFFLYAHRYGNGIPEEKNCPDVMPVCRCLISLSACAPSFKSYFCCLQSSYRTNKSKEFTFADTCQTNSCILDVFPLQFKQWSLHSIQFNTALFICHWLQSRLSPGSLQKPRFFTETQKPELPPQASNSAKTAFQQGETWAGRDTLLII